MTRLIDLRALPLDPAEVEAAVSHPGAGAVVSFLGRVRDHNDGKVVTLLEYEAYAPMAVREMTRIVDCLETKYPTTQLAILHRVGMLEVGELAVVCAASAPHRDEAFCACRELIDSIKADVPIWKREHGPEGPYWVGWEDARCTGQHESGGHHSCDHSHAPESNAPSFRGLVCLCLTVSDSRTLETDESGKLGEALLSRLGAKTQRLLVRDEREEITGAVSDALQRGVSLIVLSGGTGIGPRDVTIEAIEPLLERKIDGFGETFRQLSMAEVGTRAILSRALAGSSGQSIIAALPGSPKAVRLGLTDLLIPILPHAFKMLRGEGHGN